MRQTSFCWQLEHAFYRHRKVMAVAVANDEPTISDYFEIVDENERLRDALINIELFQEARAGMFPFDATA